MKYIVWSYTPIYQQVVGCYDTLEDALTGVASMVANRSWQDQYQLSEIRSCNLDITVVITATEEVVYNSELNTCRVEVPTSHG